MATGKRSHIWTLLILLLVAIIVTGGVVAWSRYSPGEPIVIQSPPGTSTNENLNSIYIAGAVAAPGLYPLRQGDSLPSLIGAAGGPTSEADLGRLRLYVPPAGEGTGPQKIDLNRADVWLLKALDGVGDALAERIVAYRQQNGPFRNINELTRVPGIGPAVLEKIKDRITVSE
ncbi:MAG: ComEA family DNA-binding protein [Chloroflexi bacterium]|nr:ComEA family DNA-binding protein [Chloroflexota bacterium]